MKRLWIAAAAMPLAALVAWPASAESDAAKTFKKSFSETPNSWERRDLVKRLDPKDDDQLDLIVWVLKNQDWYMREAAIETLATAYDPGLIGKLEKMGGARGDPVVVEGVCMAFGQSGNKERIPFLAEQLASKKWIVQRSAAIALGRLPAKESVEALITCWEKCDNFMVWVHILESLERITHEKNMPRAADWRGWWNAVKDTWTPPEPKGEGIDDEEAKSGDRIRTKVRGTNLDLRSRGKGLPLLVLPDYGCEKDYLETYLRNLEETNQILYVKLPGNSDFSDPPLANAPGLPAPYYPIDRLVEAFEELHTTLVKENKIENKPFAIMGHGMTCWVAMQYAAMRPKSVRRMILVAPYSSNKAWGDGRDRLEKEGERIRDLEMTHYAQSLLYNQQTGKHNYESQSEEESKALKRKDFTVNFADFRDLEIGRIFGPWVQKEAGPNQAAIVPKYARPMGSVFIPEFSLFKLQRVQTPTLVLAGELSLWTSLEDANAISKHYGGAARVFTFKRSSNMPFIEENDKFVEVVQRFLGSAKR